MNENGDILQTDTVIEPRVPILSEGDLPEIIQGQFIKIKELDNSVTESIEAANRALDSAERAKNKSVGFGKKKAAIEELQSAGVDLAEAVQLGTKAHKISFEFQTKLAKISQYLFALGCTNLANNRTVIQQLEMKLQGASEEELSELATQEVITVVKQLKKQEDLLKKLEDLTNLIKNHHERLEIQSKKNQKIDCKLQAQEQIDKLHDQKLKLHDENDKRLNHQLKTQAENQKKLEESLQIQVEISKGLQAKLLVHEQIYTSHEQQLKTLDENHKRLEESLQAQADIDLLHSKQLESQSTLGQSHDEQLASLKEINKTLKNEIDSLKILLGSKANNKFALFTLFIAISALALSLMRFF